MNESKSVHKLMYYSSRIKTSIGQGDLLRASHSPYGASTARSLPNVYIVSMMGFPWFKPDACPSAEFSDGFHYNSSFMCSILPTNLVNDFSSWPPTRITSACTPWVY